MNLFALVFLFTVTLSLQFNQLLPNTAIAALLFCAILVPFIPATCWRNVAAAALVGLLLVQSGLRYELSHQLGPQWQGKTITARGTIEGMVQQRARGIRFVLLLDANTRTNAGLRAKRVRLNWYSAPAQVIKTLQPGQVWQFRVKLNRPRNNANPGGFDYAGWLFQRRIHALGYVRKSSENRQLGTESAYQSQTRLWLANRLLEQAGGASHGGLMQALLVGLRDGISDYSNELLRATGTAHLLAISGLHIGMLAFWGYTLGVSLWRLWGKKSAAMRSNQVEFATVVSLLAAVIYAWLAGFTLPTQRALIMLLVIFVLRLSRRHSAVLTPLSLALLLIVFNDPLAPLSPGFWLSFVSVVILLTISATGKAAETRWHQMARSHCLMGVLLFPLTALFFGQASLVAPLANAFAIPFVSVFVVPFLFVWLGLTGVAPELSELVLVLVQFNLSLLMMALGLLHDWLPAEILLKQMQPLQFGTFGCALLLALLPQLRQFRVLIVPLAVPFLWAQWSPTGVMGLRMTILAAGNQPQAVVQLAKKTVVVGFGEFYRSGGNRINSVLLPFLRARGIDQIDHLVLSGNPGDNQPSERQKWQKKQNRAVGQLTEQMPVVHSINPVKNACNAKWKHGPASFNLQVLPLVSQSNSPRSGGPCVLVVNWSGQRVVVVLSAVTAFEWPTEYAVDSAVSADAGLNTVLVVAAIDAQNPAELTALQQIIDTLVPSGVVFAASEGGGAGILPESRQMRYTLRGANSFRTDRDGAIELSWATDGKLQAQGYLAQGLRPWHNSHNH